MWHYTSADPKSILRTGISPDHSFTGEGDLGGKNAMARLGLKSPPLYVVEVSDTGQFRSNRPDIVQPHATGQGGAYDFVNTAPIPPENITIWQCGRDGPLGGPISGSGGP
jgi:hypothetical protein